MHSFKRPWLSWESQFLPNLSRKPCRSDRSPSQCQNRQPLQERHHLQVRRPKRKLDPSQQNLKLLLIGLSRDLLKATCHFLLSTIQGPMAANAAVNVWSQYLRRIASYGCMVFGVCNPGVAYEDEAAKIPEDDWLI